MTIDTKTMVSITEANQNFSKVSKVVDEHGTAVILKNNTPRYLVIDLVCTLINAIMDCGEYIIPTPTGKSLPDRKDLPFHEVVMEKQDNYAHL